MCGSHFSNGSKNGVVEFWCQSVVGDRVKLNVESGGGMVVANGGGGRGIMVSGKDNETLDVKNGRVSYCGAMNSCRGGGIMIIPRTWWNNGFFLCNNNGFFIIKA